MPCGAGLRRALLDSSLVLENFRLCGPYLGSAQPVPNYRELGLVPEAAYFNAGVLLIDVAAWRDAELSRRSLACLAQYRQHVYWWDQYALNVVLAGRWGPLDERWNQGRTYLCIRLGSTVRLIARPLSGCGATLILSTSPLALNLGGGAATHFVKSFSSILIGPLGRACVRHGSR